MMMNKSPVKYIYFVLLLPISIYRQIGKSCSKRIYIRNREEASFYDTPHRSREESKRVKLLSLLRHPMKTNFVRSVYLMFTWC